MQTRINVNNRIFEPLVSPEQIGEIVESMADRINRDYKGREPLFLCILNGSFMFAADLLRRIELPCRVSFVKFSSYSGMESSQYVRKLIGITEDLTGKDVIIVEDIIDTGLTVHELLRELETRNPASVRVAAFCIKREALRESVAIHYVGLDIPNRFVVGYGLDFDGYGRNLGGIYAEKKNE
jgi:hypoxanthine phosphoribosyltransferase